MISRSKNDRQQFSVRSCLLLLGALHIMHRIYPLLNIIDFSATRGSIANVTTFGTTAPESFNPTLEKALLQHFLPIMVKLFHVSLHYSLQMIKHYMLHHTKKSKMP